MASMTLVSVATENRPQLMPLCPWPTLEPAALGLAVLAVVAVVVTGGRLGVPPRHDTGGS